MCSAARFRYQESDAALEVERLDPGKDGERRVIDHDAALWVLERLEVAARPERPHDVGLIHAPAPAHVVEHDGVHLRQPARGLAMRHPFSLAILDKQTEATREDW